MDGYSDDEAEQIYSVTKMVEKVNVEDVYHYASDEKVMSFFNEVHNFLLVGQGQ